MSIESAISNAQTKVANAYTAVEGKGGTLPSTQNLSNLPMAISSIPEATSPTLQAKTLTAGSTLATMTTILPDSTFDGLSSATVDLTYVENYLEDIKGTNAGTFANLTVTPSTTAQTIVPTGTTLGYSQVECSAVTSSIDNNIQAGNIKSGTTILGVTGTVTALAGETRTVSITSTSGNTFTPSSGKNGITSIKCNPTNKALTITPSKTSQTKTVPSNYSGYGTVKCNAVTSSIDSNITAGNIKSGVTILGVTGTYEGSGGGGGIAREVSAQGVYQAPTTSFTFSLPSNATDINQYAMYYVFYGCTGLTSADLSSLTTLSGTYAMSSAFQNCTNLTSVDLSSLTTVSGSYAMQSAFNGCTGLTGALDLSSLTTVSGVTAMSSAFYNCTGLTGALDLSSLTTVSGNSTMYYAFYNCTGLTSVDLSSLTTLSGSSVMGYAFYNCTGLTGALDLSSLTTVSGNNAMSYAFYGCTDLTSVLFTNLETIGANNSSTNYGHFTSCFTNCTNLTSITFPKLEKIYCTGGTTTSYGTFANNKKVQKMYFPKLDTITYGSGASTTNQNACKNVFYGCSALTELHFATANQSAIEASPGYSTAWGRGAGNVTIYFDL